MSVNSPGAGEQLPLAVKLRDDARFSNFYGEHNVAAVARLKAALDEHQPLALLVGDTGSGKSHLLQAAALRHEAAGGSSFCVDMSELKQLSPDVLQGLDTAGLVCLDNLDVVCGERGWEEGLFHLHNRLQDQHAMLLVSARAVPVELPLVLPDLQSRLAAGVLLQLARPQDQDRRLILRARAGARGLDLPDEVAQYILRRADRQTGALLDVLQLLDEASLSSQRRLTIPFVKSVMAW